LPAGEVLTVPMISCKQCSALLLTLTVLLTAQAFAQNEARATPLSDSKDEGSDMVASLLGDAVSGGNHPGVNDRDSAHALPELEVALESDTTEKKRRRRRRSGLFKKIGKATSQAAKSAAKATSQAAKSAANAVTDTLEIWKKKATSIGKLLLSKVKKGVEWNKKEYRAFLFRVPKDFTGSALDTSEDYDAFNTHADAATQRVMKAAFGSMPHQDKCNNIKGNWKENHPTPFKEIASLPHGPFSVYPFKAQYENDPDGYFIEPCNAISNGYFLSLFKMDQLKKTGGCGSTAEGFAMDCIDENHLLQIVSAGMPFGSWYMHGDGGSKLGTLLDTRGMWVQFYFIYRLVLKEFVHDKTLRATLVHAGGCTEKVVPDESDGIQWVDPTTGERMCHLFWARQFKKMLTNSTMLKNNTDESLLDLITGLPTMEESIAFTVIVTLRAVFHTKFPNGDELYNNLMGTIVGALVKSKEDAAKMTEFTKLFDASKVYGFEDPKDGVKAVMDIFADFMDAMFWQESGKFGDSTKALVSHVPPDAGCTWMPHTIWHRKATRVIGGFTDMFGKTTGGLSKKLVKPSSMKLFYLDGIKPKGVYVNIIGAFDDILAGASKVYNMKRLASEITEDGGNDFIGLTDLINDIKTKFGLGWPTVGDFPGSNWPVCSDAAREVYLNTSHPVAEP